MRRTWSPTRSLLALGLVVVVVGCASGKAVTLPDDPPAVLRPLDYDTVYAVSEVDKRPTARGGLRAIQQRIDYPDALKRLGIGGVFGFNSSGLGKGRLPTSKLRGGPIRILNGRPGGYFWPRPLSPARWTMSPCLYA